MRVEIAGTGKCLPGTDLPGRTVTNEDIIELLLAHRAIKPGDNRPWLPEELTSQRIVDLVGIKERRWVDKSVNTSDLALFAAEKALAEAGIGWRDIGVLVVGTSTPEAIFPSTACLTLNKAITKGLAAGAFDEKTARAALRIPAYDVLAACTSSLYAVDIVRRQLLSPDNEHEYGLALGAEVLSRLLDFSDTNADLWGDGAGAVVLKRTVGSSGIVCAVTGTDTLSVEAAYSLGHDTRHHDGPVPVNIAIKGHDIQKFVLRIIPELVLKTLEKANRDPKRARDYRLEDIGLFVCHQANARIFDFPARKLGVPVGRFYVNVDRRGNCSSASVMMALREAVEEGRLKKGDLALLLSFGGGLTWASMLVEW